MFEHKSQSVLPLRPFLTRLGANFFTALCLTGASLFVGMAGYHWIESLSWLDSFLNAAMILGGMGQVDPLRTDAGKIFAGCYALYSGLWVVVSIGLILAPVFHRMMHHFHAHKPPSQTGEDCS